MSRTKTRANPRSHWGSKAPGTSLFGGGSVNGSSHFGKQKWIRAHAHAPEDTLRMFLASPFVRAASWQPARCSVPQQRATPEYYAVTSLNILETHAATWANPAGAVLRGASYGQSSKSCRIPFMSIWEQAKLVYAVSPSHSCLWGLVSGRDRTGSPGGLIRMVCVLRSAVELLVPWMCSSGEIDPTGNVYLYNVCFLKCRLL